MLSTYQDITTDFVRKLNIQTTTAYYTDAIIGAWASQAHRWATSFHKWPFTEGRVSTTWAGTEEYLFEGYKADTVRMIVIGDKRLQKLNYEDYLIMKERDSNSADRVFSSFGRLVIVNPNADVSGTMVAYGQYVPSDFDITDHTATTVFSGGDEEGNQAIVDEMISFAMTREKKDEEAAFYHNRAMTTLETLWARINAEKFTEQTHRTRGGMFKRVDVINGTQSDDSIRRDQFL